ncbi:hypothetical protein RJ495_005100 [Pluralibacter gergoviae]|nr:hypothetical protein [Pluralibacter gergoviae]ELD4303986.1 hypothetical protein [Pluralibacter gergoviae]
MAKNEQIKIDITGDSTGLEKALNQSTQALDKFGKSVGGGLGKQATEISDIFGKMSGGLLGMVGGATAAGAAIGGLILKTNDMVRELNQLSTQSGITVVELQQLAQMFRSTGLDAEKMADINQDAMDHIADSLRNGGGIGDDLKSVGLDIKNYVSTITSKDGGLQAVIQMYYDLKKAGASVADQKFLLESVASDASRLTGVLDNYNNAADAMNAIHSQSVAVTDDVSQAFKTFDNNLQEVTRNAQSFMIDFIKPTIDELNDLYALFNKDWTKTQLIELMKGGLKNFVFGGDGVIPDFLRKQFNVGAAEVTSNAKTALDNFKHDVDGMLKDSKEHADDKPKQDKAAAQNEKLQQDKLQKARDAAAAKEKAQREKNAREQLTAQRNLDAALAQLGEDSIAVRLQQFDRQQKALINSITTSAKTLKLPESTTQGYLDRANASGTAQRNDLINGMIGYEDPNKSLKDRNQLIQTGNLNAQQTGFLAQQQNQRINGDNPFNFNDTDQKLQQNDEAMQLELQQNDLLLKGHEDYEKRKAEITAKYNAQAIEISNQNAQEQLGIFANAADGLGQAMAAGFGQGSAAAKAAFAIQKGITIAQTIMSIQSAMAQALATPWPANIANYAQVATLGMSIIGTAKNAASGQFHGGIDELPSSLDNKSFVLKKGERVVQPESNKKLTKFLDEQDKKGGSNSGDIIVNAPLIVQGDVGNDDKKFNEMLKKHANSVSQAVRSSQKRNT